MNINTSNTDNSNDSTTETKNSIFVQLKSKIFYIVISVLIVSMGTLLMLRNYSSSEFCPDGQRKVISLPDGTKVALQPKTSITYYPLWWSISRKVVLTGEAFFDVVSGNEFTVMSALGKVVAHDASFNIIANENKYIVTSFSGFIEVFNGYERSAIIKPDFTAKLEYGELKVSKYNSSNPESSNNSLVFDFEAEPLSKVFKALENEYGITISSSVELNYLYTGLISKHKSVDEILYVICKPYEFTFVVLSDKKYHIVKIK